MGCLTGAGARAVKIGAGAKVLKIRAEVEVGAGEETI